MYIIYKIYYDIEVHKDVFNDLLFTNYNDAKQYAIEKRIDDYEIEKLEIYKKEVE